MRIIAILIVWFFCSLPVLLWPPIAIIPAVITIMILVGYWDVEVDDEDDG